MNFLSPGLFAALVPLVALPLAVHLLNRRVPLRIPFPNIERIVKSLAGRSRVARWRHLIMLLLRTAVVALALLAFLMPVLPRLGSEESATAKDHARRIVLVVDRSLSMEHKGGTQASAARQLLIEAGKITATLKASDGINAVIAERAPSVLLPSFVTAHDQVTTSLAALPPGLERADIPKALALAGSLVADRPADSEIFILSDFQRSAWADVVFDSIPTGVRLFFVDVSGGERERSNTALLKVTPSAGTVSARELVRLDIVAANYSPSDITLPLEAVVDGRTATPGEMKIAAWSTGRTTLDISAPGPGVHGVEVRIPDDSLNADNRRWMRLDVMEREEVLVLCDDESEDSGLKFVLAALDPFDGRGGAFSVRHTKTTEVTAQQIGAASRIVLTGAGRLTGDMITRLTGFIKQGGGVLWFLDGAADAQNMEALDQTAGGGLIPFQLAGRLTTENFGGTPQRVARGKFESRFMRLFRGAGRQSLSLLEFYAMQRALPTAHGSVILSYADGMPAVGTGEAGLGSVVFCNFAPAELASNIARQRLFPAWIQDMVKSLRPDTSEPESLETGGSVTADLWLNDFQKSHLLAPDGSQVSAKTLIDSGRILATFTGKLPGLYTLGKPGPLLWAGAVNVPEEESDLRSIDPEEIRRRSATGAGRAGNFVSGARDYSELSSGRPVFHWFLLAAAAFLVVEMLLFRPFLRAAGHPTT